MLHDKGRSLQLVSDPSLFICMPWLPIILPCWNVHEDPHSLKDRLISLTNEIMENITQKVVNCLEGQPDYCPTAATVESIVANITPTAALGNSKLDCCC